MASMRRMDIWEAGEAVGSNAGMVLQVNASRATRKRRIVFLNMGK
jgi:hypothetical protein